MKTAILTKKPLALVVVIVALVWGCKDDKYEGPTPQQKQQNAKAAAQDNATMIATSQETMDQTALAFEDRGVISGRTSGDGDWGGCKPNVSGDFNIDNSIPDSVIYSGSITLDYGDGSSCNDSLHSRSGKITDTFVYSISKKNKKWFSSMETIVFMGFHRDTTQLDGTIVIKSTDKTNTSVEGQGAKISYADGTSATWSGTLNFAYEKLHQWRDWWGGKNIKATGALTGISRTGANFTATITQEVVFTNTCSHHHQLIPVSGLIDVTTDGTTSTVDFGDGSCDKTFTTTTNGEVETHTWDKKSL